VRGHRSAGRAAQRRVLRIGLAAGLASLLPGALTGFGVIALVEAGYAPSSAGVLFAVANALGVLGRAASGFVAEWPRVDTYLLLAGILVVGGVAAALLTVPVAAVTLTGLMLGLSIGSSWPGLMFHLVVRGETANAGSSASVVQTGAMLGSTVGPGLMGALEGSLGLGVAWAIIGALGVVGAGVVVTARRAAGLLTALSGP
jgi:hypothetical protein